MVTTGLGLAGIHFSATAKMQVSLTTLVAMSVLALQVSASLPKSHEISRLSWFLLGLMVEIVFGSLAALIIERGDVKKAEKYFGCIWYACNLYAVLVELFIMGFLGVWFLIPFWL